MEKKDEAKRYIDNKSSNLSSRLKLNIRKCEMIARQDLLKFGKGEPNELVR